MMVGNTKTILAFTLAVALVLVGLPVYAGQLAPTDTAGMENSRMYIHKKAMAPSQSTDKGRIWNCPCSRNIATYHQLRGAQTIVGDMDYQPRRTGQSDTGQQRIAPDKTVEEYYIR